MKCWALKTQSCVLNEKREPFYFIYCDGQHGHMPLSGRNKHYAGNKRINSHSSVMRTHSLLQPCVSPVHLCFSTTQPWFAEQTTPDLDTYFTSVSSHCEVPGLWCLNGVWVWVESWESAVHPYRAASGSGATRSLLHLDGGVSDSLGQAWKETPRLRPGITGGAENNPGSALRQSSSASILLRKMKRSGVDWVPGFISSPLTVCLLRLYTEQIELGSFIWQDKRTAKEKQKARIHSFTSITSLSLSKWTALSVIADIWMKYQLQK